MPRRRSERINQKEWRCPGCCLVKSPDEFYKSKDNSYGHAVYCKECSDDNSKAYLKKTGKNGWYLYNSRRKRKGLDKVSFEEYKRMQDEGLIGKSRPRKFNEAEARADLKDGMKPMQVAIKHGTTMAIVERLMD